MKKFLIFIFSLIILIAIFTVSSYASEQKQVQALDEELASTLKSQISSDDYALLGNRELYDDSLSSFNLSDQPIIKIYRTYIYWELCDLELNDIIEYAEAHSHTEYVVFGEQDIRIGVFEKDNNITLYKSSENAGSVNYVADIKKAKSNMSILGKDLKVNNIYCFDAFSSHSGALVYYHTDKGVFAKYYEDQLSQGKWFTEEDFIKYGKSYYEYITSYEYNHNEKGELLGGGISFLSFVNDVYPNQSKKVYINPLFVIIPCVVLLCTGVGVYFIIRASKKRKINKQAYFYRETRLGVSPFFFTKKIKLDKLFFLL